MILALDTATEWAHLALLGEGSARWAARLLTSPANSASKALLPSVDGLLRDANAQRRDIKGVAACIGPGGFTSLRVGVATAEGLGAMGLKTWGFSSFELRAHAIKAESPASDGIAYILLDGQRGEAFMQPWDMEKMRPAAPAQRVPLGGLSAAIGGGRWWAPERFSPRIVQAAADLSGRSIPLKDEGRAALGALVELGRICAARPEENPLSPFYLRETDAEINFPLASAHLSEAHRRGLPR